MNNFLQRSATGILFGLCIIGSIISEQWLFSFLFLIFTVVAIFEFVKLYGDKNHKLPGVISVSIGTIVYVLLSLFNLGICNSQNLIVLVPLLFVVIGAFLFVKTDKPFQLASGVLMSVFYIAVPFALLGFFFNFKVWEGQPDYILLLAFFAFIWINDTGAYLTGKAFGNRKLWPRVSPGKTWEGFAGGLIFSLLAALIWQIYYPAPDFLFWFYYALIIVVFGTFGDLLESLLKRSAGVKDSGKFFPGHGGVLDRLDSTVLAAPMAYAYIYFFI